VCVCVFVCVCVCVLFSHVWNSYISDNVIQIKTAVLGMSLVL